MGSGEEGLCLATEGSEAQGPVQVIHLGEDRPSVHCGVQPLAGLWLAPWAEEKSKEGVKFLGFGLPHGMGLCLWGPCGAHVGQDIPATIPPSSLQQGCHEGTVPCLGCRG